MKITEEKRAYNKKYYADHREQILSALDREACRARVSARRDFLADIKIKSGCADCGFNKHPDALHFDHVIGVKSFCLGNGGRYNLMEAVLAEIAKCEIRCANCHAIKHAEQRRTTKK